MYLKNFQCVRPRFEEKQEKLLDWIISHHTEARAKLNDWNLTQPEAVAFSQEIRERLLKLGLGENKIKKRGFQLEFQEGQKMQLFEDQEPAQGAYLETRMAEFEKAASTAFETIYPQEALLPPHLIHVTCTGYVAPSPAQKIVSKYGKGKQTTVTHAYHMGCYGSVPATRMAMGHYLVEAQPSDIVHTEFCTLHFNPTLHTTEQLMVQSLFADGCIKYTLGDKSQSPCLKIEGVLEEIIDGSLEMMSWMPYRHGFQMTVAREIPLLLRANLGGYLEALSKKVGGLDMKHARFAIHPGGPKILEQIAKKLELTPAQLFHSTQVLHEYGNMSSATLPHIWQKMLDDPEVKAGESIISLAFGPGLSISGIVLKKEA